LASLPFDFLFKPTICAQENVMSYVIRTKHFGVPCGIALSFDVRSKQPSRLGLAFPSELEKLAELYAPGLPNVDSIIRHHTLYPFFSAFLIDSQRQTMRAHFAREQSPGAWMSTGLMAAGLRWRLATCLDCVTSDYADLGYTFWRNGHLVPALALCPYHLTPLYEYCISCVRSARRSRPQPLPSEKCVCGVPLEVIRVLRTPEDRGIEIEISSAVRALLDGGLSGEVTSEDIHRTIFQRCEVLAAPQTCVRTYLANLVESRVGRETLAAYGVHSLGRHSALTRVAIGGRLSGNPFHNIFLILGLFGSVENLVSAMATRVATTKYAQVMLNGPPAMKARAGRMRAIGSDVDRLEGLRKHHRKIVLARMREFPEMKRRQLRSSDNNTYTFMVWFDKEWIDDVFPVARAQNKSALNEEIHVRTKHQFDVSLSGHIYERHSLLSAQVERRRLTHTQLVLGHPGDSYSRKKFAEMPLVSHALKVCVETNEQWNASRVDMEICPCTVAQLQQAF
jgi:hypothetical protein